MLSEQDITKRLEDIGYKTGEIRVALRDVAKVIVAKSAASYLSRLPETEQDRIRSFSDDEMQTYLAQNQYSFPPMAQEEFEKIHDETWEDYFRSVA
jgi:hypothetical protein